MPTHLAIIFDKSENSFRREMYPAYKANRSEPPEDLVPQFPLMRDSVRAFGLTPVEQDRYEADDLIATYAEQARERGADVLIISADKDLMQLVRDGVAMYDPASGERGAAGSREERKIGEEEVFAYFGVGPELVVDVQALAGDSTDNVPGAKGIGVKTAAQLITEYGDLDTLLAMAREIKQPKKRETLTDPESVRLIQLSRELVRLKRDVALEVPLDALGLAAPEGKTLVAYFKALEFTTLAKRAAEGYGVEADEIEPDPAFAGPAGWRNRRGEKIAGDAEPFEGPSQNARYGQQAPRAVPTTGPGALADARKNALKGRPFDHAKYLTITTADALRQVVAAAIDTGILAIDTETSGLNPLTADLVGLSLCVGENDSVYVPLGHVRPGRGRGREGPARRRQAGRNAGARARPARRGHRPGAAEAPAGGPGRPEDRPQHEIRLAHPRAARHRRRADGRHAAALLRARRRPHRPRHGRAQLRRCSPTSRSRSPPSPARAAPSSASPAPGSTRPPTTPPRTPTSRCGCGAR